MAWTVDPAHTTVGFSARHMGLSTVRGRFTRFHGSFDVDPSDLTKTGGRVEIDAASIDTGNPDRDAHLRSADFFDVERFPAIVFEPRRVEPTCDGEFTVVGSLTIRDHTQDVTLRYEHAGEGRDPFGNRKLGGSMSGEIRRSEWGLTWNVALEAGGWLVSDKIKIEIDGQLAEQVDTVAEEAELEQGSSEVREAVDRVMERRGAAGEPARES